MITDGSIETERRAELVRAKWLLAGGAVPWLVAMYWVGFDQGIGVLVVPLLAAYCGVRGALSVREANEYLRLEGHAYREHLRWARRFGWIQLCVGVIPFALWVLVMGALMMGSGH